MKKVYIFITILVLSLCISGLAVAATTLGEGGTASTNFGGGVYRPSTKVAVIAIATANQYCATSQHSGAMGQSSGLQFATLSTSPAIPGVLAEPSTTYPAACGSATAVPNNFNSTLF